MNTIKAQSRPIHKSRTKKRLLIKTRVEENRIEECSEEIHFRREEQKEEGMVVGWMGERASKPAFGCYSSIFVEKMYV